MKILFDDNIFSSQKYGGVSKYFCEIIKRFPKESWRISSIFTNNEYIRSTRLIPYVSILPKKQYKGQSRLPMILNHPLTLASLVFRNFDILHQTDFYIYPRFLILGKKMVITFHDMNYVKYRDLFPNKKAITKREKLQKECLKRADRIIAISESTKNDLIEIWKIPSEKITVIHHGVDKHPDYEPNLPRITTQPYILFVGERYGFKNFERFIKAFKIIEDKVPELKIVCTGPQLAINERKMLDQLNLTEKIIHVSASEKLMTKLYREAELFVYPSLSEGFGMPILEAMVNNCPVLLSYASCLPEIAGDAGLYFDPYSEEDIADKIFIALNSKKVRSELIEKGKIRLEKFSWEKSASEHLSVYKSII